MSLLMDKEMPSVCRKCKEQGKLAGGLYHVHTEDNFINAYCDGDPSTGCPILGEIPDEHGRLVDADKLKNELIEHGHPDTREWYYAEVDQFIDEAPIIVEASK